MGVNNALIRFCNENKPLIIYGAGKIGRAVGEFLRKHGIEIFCFCVTQIDETREFLGCSVKEIAEVQREYNNAGVVVAVSEKFSEDVLERVQGLRYFYDKDLLQEIEKKHLEEEAEKHKKEVKVEGSVLCCVGEVSFREDAVYILCPGSIGDTLYVASLVKAYKCRNGVRSVYLVVRENQKSIGELFPSVDGSIVSNEIVEKMDLYFRNKAIWELDNYRYGFARVNLSNHSYMPPYIVKNLLSGYKIGIMGLGEEAEYEEMHIGKKMPPSAAIDRKTIIVMPHESSARRLPLSLWEELCRKLGEKYKIYTNTKDETELPIKGTQPISESLRDMAELCGRCFAVISIRTGMCDLLAFTKCNLIVLNTERELAQKWDLKKVFSRDNLVNIDCYGDFDSAVLKRKILLQLKEFSLMAEESVR